MSQRNISASLSKRKLLMRVLAGTGVVAASGAVPFLSSAAFSKAARSSVIHIDASLPPTGSYEKVLRICKDAYDFCAKASGARWPDPIAWANWPTPTPNWPSDIHW